MAAGILEVSFVHVSVSTTSYIPATGMLYSTASVSIAIFIHIRVYSA